MLGLSLTILAAAAVQPILAQTDHTEGDWTQFVDPFAGTEWTAPGTSFNGGNTFPEAVIPLGSVKLGPDCTSFTISIGITTGYLPDGNVTDFSLTHVSDTGGDPVYGVVSQKPSVSLENVNVLDNLTFIEPRAISDCASVGYCRPKFQNGIVTELSAASNTGILQYTFPNDTAGHILVNVSHYLPSNAGRYHAQYYANKNITVSENAPSYQVYFCREFDTVPTSRQTFSGIYTDPYHTADLNAQPRFSSESTVNGGSVNYLFGDRVGAVFNFSSNSSIVMSKVGISWISVSKACEFKQNEIPGWNLINVTESAKKVWNDHILSTITTSDLSNRIRLQMFYTGLYHTALMPQIKRDKILTGKQMSRLMTTITFSGIRSDD